MSERREQLLLAAMAAGKFPRRRLAHYRAAYNADPEGTTELVGRLATSDLLVELHPEDYTVVESHTPRAAAGPIPTKGDVASNWDSGTPTPLDDDGHPDRYLGPEERERIIAAREGRPPRRIIMGGD